MPLSKKQKHPLKQKFQPHKNMTSMIFRMCQASCSYISKKKKMGFFVVVFFYEGKPYFECIEAKDLRWN